MRNSDDSSAPTPESEALPWVERARVQNGIMALIVINAIILGLETVLSTDKIN